MKQLILKNRSFFLPFVILWLGLTFVLVIGKKDQIHLFTNNYHSPFFDAFFKYITYLGDGVAPAVLAVVLLLFSIRKSLFIGGSALISGLLAQLFKRMFFPEYLRPKAALKGIDLYLVPNVEVHEFYSFPSGHTTVAFCMFLGIAILSRKPVVKFMCFISALVVGYSRIYLSQHFLVDTYFGALLGLMVTVLFAQFILKANSSWLDKSIISLLKGHD